MSLLNPAREMTRDAGVLSGQWRPGTVIENDDPERRRRLKVRVNDQHRGVKDAHLAWYVPLLGSIMGAAQESGDLLPIPVIGSRVYIMQQGDDPYHGLWIGGAVTTDCVLNELAGEDYPDCYGRVDLAGNLWLVNQKTCKVRFVHVSGAGWYWDGKGHMKLVTADEAVGEDADSDLPKGLTFEVQGDFTVKATEKIVVEAQSDLEAKVVGDATIEAQGNIKLKAGGTVSVSTNGGATTVAGTGDVRVATTGIVSIDGSLCLMQGGFSSSPETVGSAPEAPEAPEARERPTQDPPKENDTRF